MGVKGGHRQARPALTIVDNPYFSADHPESRDNPRQVEAVVNLRENSTITLAAKGVLDATQVAAAFRFRNAWEPVQGARQASIGFSEWVDAGRLATGLPERRLAAAADLRCSRRLLGAHGYQLVGRVCGDGFHIRDIYQTRRQRDVAIDLLKIHLSELAEMWSVRVR
jgi:hypothetical protein